MKIRHYLCECCGGSDLRGQLEFKELAIPGKDLEILCRNCAEYVLEFVNRVERLNLNPTDFETKTLRQPTLSIRD